MDETEELIRATEPGRPLYTSLGFELVADLSVWVLQRPTDHGRPVNP